MTTEFNQHKYANRQLCSETVALELSLAPVLIFHCNPNSKPTSEARPGGASAPKFLLSKSPKTHARLSPIRIEETTRDPCEVVFRDPPETLRAVNKLCLDYPSLNIVYEPPLWKLFFATKQLGPFLMNSALYVYILRDGALDRKLSAIVENALRGDFPNIPVIRTA